MLQLPTVTVVVVQIVFFNLLCNFSQIGRAMQLTKNIFLYVSIRRIKISNLENLAASDFDEVTPGVFA